MKSTLQVLVMLVPVIPLCAGAAAVFARRDRVAGVSRLAAWASLVLSAGLAVWLAAVRSPVGAGSVAGVPGLLRLDALSVAMSVLVGFIGLAVVRFSANYLRGDAEESRYWRNLNLCVGATQVLVLAGHLVVLVAAWVVTSLALHGLLLHFRNREEARVAAWKKFIVSRTGDLCFVAAVVLLHRASGTYGLGRLEAWALASPASVPGAACALLAACGLLKSAQFPFHSWLPDALETPTTVSALMHAGVVNAGGFLLLRLGAVMASSPGALAAVAVVGCATALYGSVVMLAQPSVKRRLAYSTVAQMGFMMVEIGLGAFSLALLHLLAHSVYKAQAFLRSGSAVAAPRGALPRVGVPAVLAGLAVSALFVVGTRSLADASSEPFVFEAVLGLGVAYGLAVAYASGSIWGATGIAALFVAAARGLHVASALVWSFPTVRGIPVSLTAAVCGVFVALFALQLVLPRISVSTAGRALHVHALNGFYVGTALRRVVRRLAPGRSAASWTSVTCNLSIFP